MDKAIPKTQKAIAASQGSAVNETEVLTPEELQSVLHPQIRDEQASLRIRVRGTVSKVKAA